jgi:hypothetical protein
LKDYEPFTLQMFYNDDECLFAYQRGIIVIGFDIGGSRILLGMRHPHFGSVYHFDREECCRPPGGLEKIADSFSQFLASLVHQEDETLFSRPDITDV